MSTDGTTQPPDYQSIEAAAARIADLAVRTPLIEHPALNDRAGGRIFLKAENLQRVGAFKFRGAYNKISQLKPGDWPGGVVACSSGNHAQGVAVAAGLCGMKATIVMPSDAPALKLARTKGFGAEVISYDRDSEDRDAIARAVAEERRAALVHPFEDVDVIAGQGTVGLELMQQAAGAGAVPDAVLVPAGGCGLLSGVAIAVKHVSPGTQLYGVEPVGFDDVTRSLLSGKREQNERATGSICDAILTGSPGVLALPIVRQHVTAGITITDDEAAAAVRFAFLELKLVLEPGGAAALAAILSNKLDLEGRTIAAVLSGGNIDPELFARIIQED